MGLGVSCPVSFNCCTGTQIAKLLIRCSESCCCCCCAHKKQTEQVVYTDRNEQIVILSTPHIELPDLVLYNDINNTDVAVFSLDTNNEVRFTSLQGRNLFQSIDKADKEHPPLLNIRRSTTPNEETDHKTHPSIATPEDVAGRTLKDILPEYMQRFLLPICKQTLQGNFLQLTIMWRGLTQLVRTYPILDYKRKIIAGMLTISPFISAFNVDVNRFSVGNIVDQPVPPSQHHQQDQHPNAILGSIGPETMTMKD